MLQCCKTYSFPSRSSSFLPPKSNHPVFCIPAAIPFMVMIRVSDTTAWYKSLDSYRPSISLAQPIVGTQSGLTLPNGHVLHTQQQCSLSAGARAMAGGAPPAAPHASR